MPIEKLLEREKQTLSLVLREKVFESHDLEKIIKLEIKRVEGEPAKIIFMSALKHVQEVREDCFNIAKKLGVK
ncbi:MAG: hypothetical protein MJ245_00515 [Clostridia bacterium]|nr:hypothetical protein [Clostridia bacterium]